MIFMIFYETLVYSRTPRASKMFSENVLGVGYHFNTSRKSISDVFRLSTSGNESLTEQDVTSKNQEKCVHKDDRPPLTSLGSPFLRVLGVVRATNQAVI